MCSKQLKEETQRKTYYITEKKNYDCLIVLIIYNLKEMKKMLRIQKHAKLIAPLRRSDAH